MNSIAMNSVKPFFVFNFLFFVNLVLVVLDAEGSLLYPTDEYAGVIYRAKVSKAQAVFGVWKPRVAKSDGNFSYSLVRVGVEDSNGMMNEFVEAGWAVNASCDDRPRFYVKTSTSFNPQYCVNTECGVGVFQIAQGAVDAIQSSLEPPSAYGEREHLAKITLNREIVSLDNSSVWSVYLQEKLVGYYPGSLYKNLAKSASRVDIGGQVSIMSNGTGSPHSGTEMGSGLFPKESFNRAATIRNIELFGDNGSPITPAIDLEPFPIAQNSNCYNVSIEHSQDPDWGTYIFYGGPGGNAAGCRNIQ